MFVTTTVRCSSNWTKARYCFGRFWSSDLWVMNPTRFRFATKHFEPNGSGRDWFCPSSFLLTHLWKRWSQNFVLHGGKAPVSPLFLHFFQKWIFKREYKMWYYFTIRPKIPTDWNVITLGGFDPPTFGLWIQHDSVSPQSFEPNGSGRDWYCPSYFLLNYKMWYYFTTRPGYSFLAADFKR